MKCPVCNEDVTELEEKCPKCGTNFDEYDKKHNKEKENKTDEISKTTFIKVINIFQLFGFIIMAIMSFSNDEILQAVIYVIIGLVVFVFIKGFSDIIDLLDSINDKIGK